MKLLATSIAFFASCSALACFAPIKEQDDFVAENDYDSYIQTLPYAVDSDFQIMEYCTPYAAIVEKNNTYLGNFSFANLWYDFSFAYIKLQHNNNKNSNFIVIEPSQESPYFCNGNKLEHKSKLPIISTGKSIYKNDFVRIKFLNAKSNKNYLTVYSTKNVTYFALNKKGSEFQLENIINRIDCNDINAYCSFNNNKQDLQLKFIPLNEKL
nr:hypothetical protein GTC16762_26340 [Pigmentibacter ruber]